MAEKVKGNPRESNITKAKGRCLERGNRKKKVVLKEQMELRLKECQLNLLTWSSLMNLLKDVPML